MVNILKGDVLLGVQGNFVITTPLPIHFYDAKTQLTDLAQIGVERGLTGGAEAAVEFDPFDYGFHRDPYPTYEWLRELAPVYHNARMGFWALSRFDDVLAGLARPRDLHVDGRRRRSSTPTPRSKSMIEMDPPDHTRMRKLIARRFTPRRIADLEPRVREWTNALLDSLEGRASSTSCASSPRCCPRRSSARCWASRPIVTTTPAGGPTTS